MKTTVMSVFISIALLTGCAHQTLAPDGSSRDRDVRGSTRVGHEARMIVAGPALMVHATGEKPVRWFVADRITGTDSNCKAAPVAATSLPPSTGVHLTIAPGNVLCAAVAQGATDVAWHQFLPTGDNMWALR